MEATSFVPSRTRSLLIIDFRCRFKLWASSHRDGNEAALMAIENCCTLWRRKNILFSCLGPNNAHSRRKHNNKRHCQGWIRTTRQFLLVWKSLPNRKCFRFVVSLPQGAHTYRGKESFIFGSCRRDRRCVHFVGISTRGSSGVRRPQKISYLKDGTASGKILVVFLLGSF